MVDLRRGVSAAYYAAFHELSQHGAEHVLPRAAFAERAAFRRSYAHGSFRTVSRWVAGHTRPGGRHIRTVVDIAADPPMVRVAERFVDLQYWRHEADYDPRGALSKADVHRAVRYAQGVCDDLAANRGTEGYHAFMALLTLGTRELR